MHAEQVSVTMVDLRGGIGLRNPGSSIPCQLNFKPVADTDPNYAGCSVAHDVPLNVAAEARSKHSDRYVVLSGGGGLPDSAFPAIRAAAQQVATGEAAEPLRIPLSGGTVLVVKLELDGEPIKATELALDDKVVEAATSPTPSPTGSSGVTRPPGMTDQKARQWLKKLDGKLGDYGRGLAATELLKGLVQRVKRAKSEKAQQNLRGRLVAEATAFGFPSNRDQEFPGLKPFATKYREYLEATVKGAPTVRFEDFDDWTLSLLDGFGLRAQAEQDAVATIEQLRSVLAGNEE